MINYIEKGGGLHVAIQSAGYSLSQHDGAWVSDNDAAVQLLIDNYSLAQSVTYKQSDVDKYAKRLRDKVIASTSPGEMSSWPIKASEAKTYNVSKNAVDAPMLSAEALARGSTLDSVVARVLTNAAKFGGLETQVAGISGRHRDAIAACTTFERIATYDYSTGWPVV